MISIMTQEEESIKKGKSHTPFVSYLSHGLGSKVGDNDNRGKKPELRKFRELGFKKSGK